MGDAFDQMTVNVGFFAQPPKNDISVVKPLELSLLIRSCGAVRWTRIVFGKVASNELDANGRLKTASPVLIALFRGLCKEPPVLFFRWQQR